VSLGVTVGKFYPFHLGHDLLIRRAKAQVEQLVVLVGFKPGQQLSGALRADWVREAHPDVEVIEVLEDIPEAPEPWGQRALEVLGRAPAVAFTSEDYGEAWAEAMGCRHQLIDLERESFPISGTALREDLGAGWSMLTAPAKAHFTRRVRVLGVESSGTTTLARALAERLNTAWVPEYGRWYWEGRRHAPTAETWSADEFRRIARGQQACEDDLARQANRVLVCDTDALATHVWHRRYRGHYDPVVEALAAERRYDLTLLTAPDFPFVQDGTRESEAIRHAMHGWFVDVLKAEGGSYRLLEGSPEERLAAALEAVEPLLRFDPLEAP
jgi:NadR type nicotinamide-nucleotide adenylyltransferase